MYLTRFLQSPAALTFDLEMDLHGIRASLVDHEAVVVPCVHLPDVRDEEGAVIQLVEAGAAAVAERAPSLVPHDHGGGQADGVAGQSVTLWVM